VKNDTNSIIYVTTENFRIKNKETGNYLKDEVTKEIFPPNPFTGYFIDFVRLRPKISDELFGEKLHLTCEFSIGNAKEDGMFNVVSTCSYGFTVDELARDAVLSKKKQQWKDEGKSEDEIDFEEENWKLLDGMRITKKDSFDFTIQTIGVYKNSEILDKACQIILMKLDELETIIEKDELEINYSENTMNNCFDIILEDEDYTIGKVIEFMLYQNFYESTKMLTFCGFKKEHPHDSFSIIRVAYKDAVEKSTIKGHLKDCIIEAKKIYIKIRKEFLSISK
jgi:DNA-directed RNA polymerase subunit L